jgi:hypothetical protein
MPSSPPDTAAPANPVRPFPLHLARPPAHRPGHAPDVVIVIHQGSTTVYENPEALALAMRRHDRLAIERGEALAAREREAFAAERRASHRLARARRLAGRTLRVRNSIVAILTVLGWGAAGGAALAVVVWLTGGVR